MQTSKIKNILIILINFNLIVCIENNFGYVSQIKSDIGSIWPRPKYERRFENNFLDPKNINFVIVGATCDILNEALIRYTRIIRKSIDSPIYETQLKIFGSSLITKIAVNLTSKCERLPHLEMDESYRISGAEYISANSIWGILRALETYSQAITPTLYGMLNVPHLRIIDSPRFPHRGLLLDTARHYMTIDTIFTILDGMAYNKLNVFHWHIVDDESFPYQSIKFPELSEKGAFKPRMVYTQENISNIIEYARMRGIRVVAEFDMPGHSRSWGNSHPEILTVCESNGNILGPMYPINKKTFKFLHKFFSEVLDVFPDNYMHLGGDENDFNCWISNLTIRSYVISNEISYWRLQNTFMQRVSKFLINKSRIPIVWEEVMDENSVMPKETIVQVWLRDWQKKVYKLSSSGYRIILSTNWYLDPLLNDGTWETFYNIEPHNFTENSEQKKFVIGGEACMWGENINDENVIKQIFPRVSAIAERLWSSRYPINMTDVQQRLEEHSCRMILRGISSLPLNGSQMCLK